MTGGGEDRWLSLREILDGFPRVELAAVNQCSGNSRDFFQPRVAGGQWANGAMGNALWAGVRLKDVLDRAGVKPGAVEVRFIGLDEAVLPDAARFMKSLDIDHGRDGEVMIAYAMNDEQLPLLNGFPLRLVVPGWYSTYWVKMLNDIEVLDRPDAKPKLVNVHRGWNDRPVPAHEELVVRREYALVKDLPGRLQKRRAGALQDHRPLLRECSRNLPGAGTARQ